VPVLVRPETAGEDAVVEAVRAAAFDPPSDVHATAAYRRHLADVLAVRAVEQAQKGL
jgi:carbon-monoxide dehydrogenase medium subunit